MTGNFDTGRLTVYSGKALMVLTGGVAMVLTAPSNITRAGEGYALSGGGGGPGSYYAYQGVLYAPFGSLSDSGLQVRAWAKGYQFTYRADLPARPKHKIKAHGVSLEAEAGWQFSSAVGRIGLYGGAAWRDHKLSPDDPGSDLEDSRVGFSGTLDGEVKFSERFGSYAYATYLTGFDQYWVQLRPYMTTSGGWKLGPEAVWSGGKGYEHARAGVFFNGFEVGLGSLGRIFLGGEAGARFDLHDRDVDPYAGLNAGFLF